MGVRQQCAFSRVGSRVNDQLPILSIVGICQWDEEPGRIGCLSTPTPPPLIYVTVGNRGITTMIMLFTRQTGPTIDRLSDGQD